MSDWRLQTPVAFIIFNRPDTTARVFEEIAKARPPKLLVVADGPRTHRAGEADLCIATRAIIEQVDWPCEVLTNYSEVNLGCRKRVSSGLDWIFEQVPEAIILEDDCLPDPSFFRFCQEMLERYRHDQRIGMISGDNFQFGRRYGQDSYYFSKYVHVWGWATWRNRWVESYDVTMEKWVRVLHEGRLTDIVGDVRGADYWGKNFEKVYRQQIDTWDYQWVFANWIEGRLSILPSVNLISNIGFGENATHTIDANELASLPLVPMVFPLIHPIGVFRNTQADCFSENSLYRTSLWKLIRNKLFGFGH